MGSSTENSAFGADKKPARPDARAGRIVGRIRGGRCGGHRAHRARLRDRRLGAPAGGVLRRRRREADLRAREPVRARRVRVVARSDRRVRHDASTTPRSRSRSIAGHDPLDSTSAADAGAATIAAARRRRVDGRRHRTAGRIFPGDLDPRVRAKCDAALDALEALGADVRDVSLPHTRSGDRGLLHHRAGRGVVEPRALRRRALRTAHRGRRTARHVRGHALDAASAPKSRAASCSARTCSRRATTTRTTGRRSRCAR